MSEQQVDPRIEALRLAAADVSLSTGSNLWVEILAALDAADRAAGIARVRVVGSRGELTRDEAGNFLGFTPGAGGIEHDHRTAGPHRAWCFSDGEWCYPSAPCHGCDISYQPLDEPNKDTP